MMALAGVFAFEFQVTLPVLAKEALDQGVEGFGLMTAAMGVGAVGGGLLVAARGRTGLAAAHVAAAARSASCCCLRPRRRPWRSRWSRSSSSAGRSVAFMAIGNTTLQLAAAPEMRGRVMSLWFVAFQGSTPIGGPLLGWAMGWAGARVGLGARRVACLLVALLGVVAGGAPRLAPMRAATIRDGADRRRRPSRSRRRARERSSSASMPQA